MNILITGAAGFIGSHYALRRKQAHPDDHIVVIDILNYAADKSLLDPIIDDSTFVEGDIADTDLVRSIVNDHSIELIVNFAAETHVDKSIEDAMPFIRSNILGTQTMIEMCKEHPEMQLIQVSTDEVYGDLQNDEPAFNTETNLHPSSPYSATKAASDHLVLAAVRTYGIHACITRCTNNYGPHQDRTKLIPVIITKALNGEKIPIYGEGKQKRDWLYVTDHTDAIEAVIQHGKDGEVYLIGADNEKENIEVVHTLLDIMELPHDLIEFVAERPGHDWRYTLDSSNTQSLGWTPQVSFEEGIRQTIDWYRSLTC